MPKVSVIIPNYNHAAYLQQRIDSVLNQTCNDFEIIILDDCSTDNSKAIIEEYRNCDKVSNIIYNPQNGRNPFQQWHKGIGLAQGEYIWIAESDDWCEPTLLETLLEGFANNKTAVIGYCQGYCVNENGGIKFQSNHKQLQECVNGKKFITDYILSRNPIFNAGMALWKKDVYTLISHNYINYKLTGDYLFWVELCTCGDVFISGKLLNYFRWHEKNTSVNGRKSGLSFTEQILIFKELLERKIIKQKEYSVSIKKAYSSFRLQQRYLPKENINVINQLFAAAANSNFTLPFYFFQQYLKVYLKKILRA